ncbi:retinal pigment epithelial membrane protein-domain-containing protein [Dichotomocladium elegans]|nr:retinal pigment epithelial membrane protein-domain-containing protein [Dichotomocladium elegans]
MSSSSSIDHPLTTEEEDHHPFTARATPGNAESSQNTQATGLATGPETSVPVAATENVPAKERDGSDSESSSTDTSSDDDEGDEQHHTSHPLQQDAGLDPSAYSNDAWTQQENALLDADGSPNADRGSFPSTPLHEQQVKLDSDTSHVKGFQNSGSINGIIDLEVKGQLPDWLNGELYTIGPGTYDIRYTRKIEIDGFLQSATSTFSFGHWFDADHHGYASPHPAGLFKTDSNQTMLVKFLKSAPKASKPDGEPCGARILAGIPGIDGRLFAQNLANHIQELDPFDLKPTRVLCWNEINPAFKGYSSCPNGQYDSQTGEYINFTMEIGYQSTAYNFFSISDRNPKGSMIASVTAPTGYVHSFSLTPKYIILAIVVFPLLANTAAVKFSWNESIMDSFSFYPSEPTLFYVISREKGQHLVTYRADPCFAFHHVNAYEDGNDNVICDIICYRDDTIAHQLTTHNLRNPSEMKPSQLAPSELRRFVLSNIDDESLAYLTNYSILPSAASVTTRVASVWNYIRGSSVEPSQDDVEHSAASAAATSAGWAAGFPVAACGKLIQPSMELPQVNPLYKMHRYQYVYGVGFSAAVAAEGSMANGQIWDSIVKADVQSNRITGSWHEENCYPSEAVFIGRRSATPSSSMGGCDEVQEDDGVLVSVVLDSARATSFLLVLDARTLKEIARADLGVLIPLSFARGSYRLRA